MAALKKADWLRLIERGVFAARSNYEVAALVGMTPECVRRWRIKLGVPAFEAQVASVDWGTVGAASPEAAAAERRDREAQKTVARLQGAVSDEKRARSHAEREASQADERLAVALALREAPRATVDVKPRGKRRKSEQRGIPVLLCSDWHVEEVVDPATINGRNEYGPEVAERRARYLAEGAAWMAEQWAKGWSINQAVVWFGGDMITGYIHEELQESNALSPVEAVLLAQRMMGELLCYLLERCKFLKTIHVPCSFGNHGRCTQKRRISTGATNSFEWLAYHTLAQQFASEPRVQFSIADGAHLYTSVYGTRVRWHHGDDVRYQGGVGGLSIPLRKACDAWDEFEPADLTCIGHWHQMADYGFAVCNGSLIGFNAYALSIKARWEPARQAMFLVDEDWGKRLVTPVYCDPDRRAR